MAEGIISRFCMALLRLTPVLFVSAVIIWSYYAYAVHMCIFTVKNVPEKVIYLVFYHPFLLMMVWCFLKTICSEPAAVPTQYYLSESDLEKFENLSPPEQKQFLEQRAIKLSVQCRTNAGAVRFCVGCRCIKPDRAHHCSVCQKCILKMDHHCPWVNNCICFSSYKFFVLLISYSLLYCLFVSATSFQYFIKFWLNVYGGDVEVSNLNNVFLFFAGIVFVLSLTGLLCYHSSLIARNRTTLEAFRAPIFRSGPDRNGFNLGTYANFMEVFGNRKLLWFLPVFTALGDGAKFTTRIAPASVGYQSMGTSSIGLEPYINLQTTPVMIQPAPKFNETSYGGGTDDDMNSPEENYRNPSGECLRLLTTSAATEKSSETALLKQLKATIRLKGPITVADYMSEVLTNSFSGYYMHKDVFGRSGDFTTSPEISQMFGELVGIWCVNEWMRCGSSNRLNVVELGPGRGTLADDMLRVFSKFPDLHKAVSLHLVEVSPEMSRLQRKKLTGVDTPADDEKKLEDGRLPSDDNSSLHYSSCVSRQGVDVRWYKQLSDVPRGPMFLVAHEFLDALPIHIFQKHGGNWHEVLVDMDDRLGSKNHLRFVLSPGATAASSLLLKDLVSDPRDHIELCPRGAVIVSEIAERIEKDGGFGLLVDYGHLGEKTDTFRAFKKHKLHDPLSEPGIADLTADVDFAYLQKNISSQVSTFGPVTQEKFLHGMGIGVRLQVLLSSATTEQRKSLITGYDMLTNPAKMGERFKFFAILEKLNDGYVPAGFTALQ